MRRLLPYAAIALWFAVVAGWLGAQADPVVRHAFVHAASYPQATAPVTLLLIADTEVAGPDMPPARLVRIIAQARTLRPDVVVFAGDLVSARTIASRHYDPVEAITPLAPLKGRLGTVAVLGNHDHDIGARAVTAALRRNGITVLDNRAVRIGPLAIAGSDNRLLRRKTLEPPLKALRETPGVGILVSHYPGGFEFLPESVPLMLAGHTHCGQIALPWLAGLPCGVSHMGGRTRIVTAGLGASIVPLRLGSPPDMWLVTIGR
jgi:predicted MPP superfamily phosphohydrolase